MSPTGEGAVPRHDPAPKPAARDSYWELVAIPIRRYRLVLLCSLLWCGFQTARVYLGTPTYTSSATFRPRSGSDNLSRSLARLATLTGMAPPRTGIASELSNDFYEHIMTSRDVIDDIISRTYELSDGRRVTLPDLLEVTGDSEERRISKTRRRVRDAIETRQGDADIMRFTVTTRWPEVSYAIARGLLEALDSFQSTVIQSDLKRERAFISQQMERTIKEVNAWEDTLQAFLAGNRGWNDHSELNFTVNRIQAELQQRRSVHTQLIMTDLQAGINEVRETPSLLVTGRPRLPRLATQQEFTFGSLLTPLITGAFAGVVVAMGLEWLKRIWDYDNPVVTATRDAWPRLTSISFLRTWFWPQ